MIESVTANRPEANRHIPLSPPPVIPNRSTNTPPVTRDRVAARALLLEHPTLGKVRAEVREVPDDPEAQVQATIDLMRQYVRADVGSAAVKEALSSATLHPGPVEHAVWKWVKDRSTFRLDPTTAAPLETPIATTLGKWRPCVEVLIRPRHFLQWKVGDCDDYTMSVAAMLLTAGIACTFVTLAADPREPQIFTHVYTAAYRPTRPRPMRTAIDASHGAYCGWQAKGSRVKEWIV